VPQTLDTSRTVKKPAVKKTSPDMIAPMRIHFTVRPLLSASSSHEDGALSIGGCAENLSGEV
jgi:hypothetical protein